MKMSFIIPIILFASSPTQDSYVTSSYATQRCEATTKKGTRCKNNALKGSKYCQIHKANDPKVKQCKATTQKGERCSRAATKEGYCTQHYNMYKKGDN